MTFFDLLKAFNTLKDKCKFAIEKANDEMAKRACTEVEMQGLRDELRLAYAEISELKHENATRTNLEKFHPGN